MQVCKEYVKVAEERDAELTHDKRRREIYIKKISDKQKEGTRKREKEKKRKRRNRKKH